MIESVDLEGWFAEDEGLWYADLARAIPRGGTLVEVGAWKGRSASFAGPACMLAGVRFVIVDHFAGSRDAYAAAYAEQLAREDVRAVLEANLRALGIAHELLALGSVEAARRFAVHGVDAVFLDASHDGASVGEDLAAWWPRIRPGGSIAGHDFDEDAHPALVAVVRAFCAEHGLALERGPGSTWSAREPGARRGVEGGP